MTVSAAIHGPCDAAAAHATECAAGADTPHPNLVLATTILASSLAFVDGSVVNVGLPAIGRSLSADAQALQWVVNAYLLPLSALLLLGGAAGDRFGRRRMLIAGVALFAVASLACALAPSLGLLLAGRFLQGVSAAMLMPNSLAILGSSFSGEARGRAIGIWAAIGAVAGAIGPVLGGWLIDLGSWRAIFLINLPVAAATIWLALRYIPTDEEDGGPQLDWAGGVLAALALGGITYALTVGSGPEGWTLLAITTGILGLALFAAFLIVEHGLGDRAMMPFGLFASQTFVGLTLLTLLLYGALGALFVLIPFVLIVLADYSGTAAGAALLPLPILLTLVSPSMGSLAARIGPRLPLAIGPLVVALGFLLALRIDETTSYWWDVLPAIVVISLGVSIAVAPLTSAVLGAVDAHHTGSASGLNSAVARTGGLVATALIGTVLAASGPVLVAAFHSVMVACAVACALASLSAVALIARPAPG